MSSIGNVPSFSHLFLSPMSNKKQDFIPYAASSHLDPIAIPIRRITAITSEMNKLTEEIYTEKVCAEKKRKKKSRKQIFRKDREVLLDIYSKKTFLNISKIFSCLIL